MNLLNQGESSGPSVQPAKRRRGRPRKDPNLKRPEATHTPVSEGVREYLPQRTDRTRGIECIVGQAVTGVVEAIFDSGYLLTVRIGNSNTNLRGVVFKPGHCVPITTDNDVAPHVQMIRRSNVHFTGANQGWSPGQEITTQTTSVVPSKRKFAPPETAPAVNPSGLQTSNHGDADVQMVEPFSMLSPDLSVPVGSFNKGTTGIGEEEKDKAMTAADNDTPGSSQTSDIKAEDGKEALKYSTEDSGIVSIQETGDANEPLPSESSHPGSVTEPSFNYGTGRMTELLKVQIAEQSTTCATEVKFHETNTTEPDPKNEGSVP